MAYIYKDGKVLRKEMPLLTEEQLKILENLPDEKSYLDELVKKIQILEPVIEYVKDNKQEKSE